MLIALRDNIIVIKHKNQENKLSAIIIPELEGHYNSYEASEVCEVLSVGPEYKQRYSDGKTLSRGDFILCDHLEGRKVVFDKQTYYIMQPRFVQAKIDKYFIGRIGTFSPKINVAEWRAGKEHFQRRGQKITTI